MFIILVDIASNQIELAPGCGMWGMVLVYLEQSCDSSYANGKKKSQA